ncbi:zinc finger protein 699-like isoform X3 [Euwallacea similis]|uniref:zinc finger protein 699-like isoform X3 n=1 Tax=Euwallacea similis TaxID=1736056 RepID=UPI00344D5880
MDNPGEILRLCRLCLVKDQVNIPIFEEQGDIRQTFLKIRSCLPVKVSRDDKLPKKICGGCSNKLDLFYEFWSSTANSEKTLQSWLGQEEEDDKMQEITKPVEALVKEESEALEDGHAHDQSFDEATKDEAEAPPAKRARRTAAVKAQINISHDSDEDEDVDGAEPITKIEDESDDSDGEEKDPSYTEVPGTSADDQAGPSGLGKDGVEAPPFQISTFMDQLNTPFLPSETPKFGSKNCPVCFRICKTTYEVRTHYASVHSELKLFGCGDCMKGFKLKHQLHTHYRGVHDLKPLDEDLRCKACRWDFGEDTYFTSKEALKFHVEYVHESEDGDDTNAKAVKCLLCEKIMKNIRCFRSHLIYHHFSRVRLKCHSCLQQFDTSHNLLVHLDDSHGGAAVFICSLCGQTEQTEQDITDHVLKEHNSTIIENLRCLFCPRDRVFVKFMDEVFLKAHMTGEHNEASRKALHKDRRIYKCPHCPGIYKQSQSLNTHIKIDHESKAGVNLVCSVCEKEYVSAYHLQKHINTKHKELNQFVCGECGMSYTSQQDIQLHISQLHGTFNDNQIACNFCEADSDYAKYFFTQASSLEKHLRSCHSNQILSTEPGEFECQKCPRNFETKDALQNHIIQTHPFKCLKCDKTFTQKASLNMHLKQRHSNSCKKCEFCDKECNNLRSYRDHVMRKHGDCNMPCDICNKNYSSSESLKQHKKIHSEDYYQRFKECHFCKRKYMNIGVHMRNFHETDGKNHICEICGKAFREKGTLKLHLMIHRNIRPHECSVCGYRFLTKQFLLKHSKQHTGEVQFVCSYCGKGLISKESRDFHERMHQGIKPFECELCSTGYYSKHYLRKHQRTVHEAKEGNEKESEFSGYSENEDNEME